MSVIDCLKATMFDFSYYGKFVVLAVTLLRNL